MGVRYSLCLSRISRVPSTNSGLIKSVYLGKTKLNSLLNFTRKSPATPDCKEANEFVVQFL